MFPFLKRAFYRPSFFCLTLNFFYMKPFDLISINGNLRFVQPTDFIETTFTIPRGNLNKMLAETNANLIWKKPTTVQHKHHAGDLFLVCVIVRFDKLKPFCSLYVSPPDCANFDLLEYLSPIIYRSRYSGWCKVLSVSNLALYAFGEPKIRRKSQPMHGVYVNSRGKKISRLYTFDKFLKTRHGWYRLLETKPWHP